MHDGVAAQQPEPSYHARGIWKAVMWKVVYLRSTSKLIPFRPIASRLHCLCDHVCPCLQDKILTIIHTAFGSMDAFNSDVRDFPVFSLAVEGVRVLGLGFSV